jgi:hypothetical protein
MRRPLGLFGFHLKSPGQLKIIHRQSGGLYFLKLSIKIDKTIFFKKYGFSS